jgi:hypothetical protein
MVGSFTRFPNDILDNLLLSNLPMEAKYIVSFVIRNTVGYQRRSILVEGKVLKQLLKIQHSQIPRLIQGLIQLNILKGGAVKKRSDGRILVYELSVNLKTEEWDIGIPSQNRTVVHEMLLMNQKAANIAALESEPVKPIPQIPDPGLSRFKTSVIYEENELVSESIS